MLYVVATPIGNLADITYRAVDILKQCDYILCEDTRYSQLLLKHYDIHKPLKSFHKFSERAKQAEILEDLAKGISIALISDAGTPGISDPGSRLIQECISNKIKVKAIPGPCAAIVALSCSGLPTDRFQFVGFLPKKKGELIQTLQELLTYSGTTICYESPHRLLKVLACMLELDPDRMLCVARELTKKFEEVRRGPAQELIDSWAETTIKGEIVLLISGQQQIRHEWDDLTLEQHIEFLQESQDLSLKEAIQAVAKERGLSKRLVYNAVHQQ